MPHRDATGDTLRGHGDGKYQRCYGCGIPLFPWLDSGVLPADNCEALLQMRSWETVVGVVEQKGGIHGMRAGRLMRGLPKPGRVEQSYPVVSSACCRQRPVTCFVQRMCCRWSLDRLLVLWNVASSAHMGSAEGAGRLMRVHNNRENGECVRNAGL